MARVLSRAAAGGRLLSSFYNPVVFVGDRDPRYAEQGLIRPAHALPYADTRHLDAEALDAARAARRWCSATRCRTRSAASSTPASCWRAFMKRQPRPRFVIDGYLPTFLATWAVKPA